MAADYLVLLMALRVVSKLRNAKDIHKAAKTLPEALHEGCVESCHPGISWNNQGLPCRDSCQQEQDM